MTFRVVVVFFSRTAKLVTLANVIAEGARAVSGAEVRVVRAREAREVTSGTNGTSTSYERGILDAEIATPEDVLEADCVLIGAPTRRGIVATEMSAFLERLGTRRRDGERGGAQRENRGRVHGGRGIGDRWTRDGVDVSARVVHAARHDRGGRAAGAGDDGVERRRHGAR